MYFMYCHLFHSTSEDLTEDGEGSMMMMIDDVDESRWVLRLILKLRVVSVSCL